MVAGSVLLCPPRGPPLNPTPIGGMKRPGRAARWGARTFPHPVPQVSRGLPDAYCAGDAVGARPTGPLAPPADSPTGTRLLRALPHPNGLLATPHAGKWPADGLGAAHQAASSGLRPRLGWALSVHGCAGSPAFIWVTDGQPTCQVFPRLSGRLAHDTLPETSGQRTAPPARFPCYRCRQ